MIDLPKNIMTRLTRLEKWKTILFQIESNSIFLEPIENITYIIRPVGI